MDLVPNPPEPSGECRSWASFFLFEINSKAATAHWEHLHLFEGTSIRRVLFLASGIFFPSNPLPRSSSIWGSINWYLGRLKMQRALFSRETPAETVRNWPNNHGCSRHNVLDNLYLQIAICEFVQAHFMRLVAFKL